MDFKSGELTIVSNFEVIHDYGIFRLSHTCRTAQPSAPGKQGVVRTPAPSPPGILAADLRVRIGNLVTNLEKKEEAAF